MTDKNNYSEKRGFIIGICCFSLAHLCLTVYLSVTLYNINTFIASSYRQVSVTKNAKTPEKRSNDLFQELIKAQSQILQEHCRSSTTICSNTNLSDGETHRCSCTYAPSISKDIYVVHATLGSDVFLPCNTTGYPEPHVTWTQGPNKIKSDIRYTVETTGLRIHNFTAIDCSNYTCVARNIIGFDTHIMSVQLAKINVIVTN